MIAATHNEPVYDIFARARGNPLDPLFAPKTIALVGASEKSGSVGCSLAKNLQAFAGNTFLSKKTFPDIASVGEAVDLAVIATPAPTVPGIVRDCAKAGIRGVIVIS